MLTTIKKIVEYWEARKDETELNVDWADAHERCWRCGYKTKLEKCHIIPKALGGSDQPSNLVLLCIRCHREAPNFPDPNFMWLWIKKTPVAMAKNYPFAAGMYDSYWIVRGFQEYEQMFGRSPLSTIVCENAEKADQALQMFRKLLDEEFKKAKIHWGEGRLNPSTIACILAAAEVQFLLRNLRDG